MPSSGTLAAAVLGVLRGPGVRGRGGGGAWTRARWASRPKARDQRWREERAGDASDGAPRRYELTVDGDRAENVRSGVTWIPTRRFDGGVEGEVAGAPRARDVVPRSNNRANLSSRGGGQNPPGILPWSANPRAPIISYPVARPIPSPER